MIIWQGETTHSNILEGSWKYRENSVKLSASEKIKNKKEMKAIITWFFTGGGSGGDVRVGGSIAA